MDQWVLSPNNLLLQELLQRERHRGYMTDSRRRREEWNGYKASLVDHTTNKETEQVEGAGGYANLKSHMHSWDMVTATWASWKPPPPTPPRSHTEPAVHTGLWVVTFTGQRVANKKVNIQRLVFGSWLLNLFPKSPTNIAHPKTNYFLFHKTQVDASWFLCKKSSYIAIPRNGGSEWKLVLLKPPV